MARAMPISPAHTPWRAVVGELSHFKERMKSAVATRSEEHTSELQSRQYLVCRLLLEKKKNKRKNQSGEYLMGADPAKGKGACKTNEGRSTDEKPDCTPVERAPEYTS